MADNSGTRRAREILITFDPDEMIKEQKEADFHCGVEESGFHAYNCNDCPNKCEEYYQWDKEFKSMTRKENKDDKDN